MRESHKTYPCGNHVGCVIAALALSFHAEGLSMPATWSRAIILGARR